MASRHWLKPALLLLALAPGSCFGQALTNPFAGNAQAAADGSKLFAQSCAPCHGRDGTGGQGQAEGMRPPDLTRGVFKAGRQDSDLFRVVSQGVRGTEMPSFASLGNDQIWRLITFVKSLSSVAPVLAGDPKAGETLFWGKGNCGSCHQVGTRGTRLGPDLTRGGRRSNVKSLRESIVDPNADITPGFAIITVETRDHQKISGLERWLDNFSARLIDQSGNERTYLRDDVISIDREMRSTMPGDYGKMFSAADIDNLVAYIQKMRSEANSQ
jgi:cytochrome c oxidase cbb3-type subunit 3